MRHGWKTRIDERMYFEQKRFERDERQQVVEFLRSKLKAEIEMFKAELDQRERWNHETH